MPSRACHRGPPSCHSSTDTAHLTTSRNLVPSSVPPAPLSAHPLYLLLQELSGPLLTNGNGGGQEEKVEKEKEGSGQEDQLVINISYACKDSERGRHVVQHVSHAALDTIDALIWSNKSILIVSTNGLSQPGSHPVHQLSPFYEINSRITSPQLDLQIKDSAHKFL
ncbi:hypothetical protein PSHT_03316 [Puccinia striiformis]|uniref:Uncharacterized protein n=1 Tax=Puccinia striiformis TaxID=27350 RepID=A0A2S4WFR1_9BASI|nr:hypothetical protein PSHT_03316 [Puccinia striiformis]